MFSRRGEQCFEYSQLKTLCLGACLAVSGMHLATAQESTRLEESACSSAGFAGPILPGDIGEPVAGVVLESFDWVEASDSGPAHCLVNGRLEPVDQADSARPIRFGVALPATWNGRAIQMGGGGMNGSIPRLAAGGTAGVSNLSSGFATYGSDSGHSNPDNEWTQNDEAIRNLGYMQMKKTHDVAMILIERAYGARPDFNYYVGTSQGGREGLTVAQRYPRDYDGVVSAVPIVGLSTLMLAPTLTRIQEIPLENWVPPVKGNALLAEFMHQCDELDGLVDGVINNYFDCRSFFNVNDGVGERDPWSGKRCANDIDPRPEDASAAACFTSAQIETLEFVFSDYEPAANLPNGRTSFGMWLPSTAVANEGGGFGPPGGMPMAPPGALFVNQRWRGQQGAADDAPVFVTLGSIGVNGIIMQDLDGNPLDLDVRTTTARHEQIAEWLDSTAADLSAFRERGGKLLVTVGTDDTIAPSGEQLNYYQSVIDTMGRAAVDDFARLYVLPQTGHGLTGRSASINGNGELIEPEPIPTGFDAFALLRNWVENDIAPGMSETVTGTTGSRPMCSYPSYPRYIDGNPSQADSFRCAMPENAD